MVGEVISEAWAELAEGETVPSRFVLCYLGDDDSPDETEPGGPELYDPVYGWEIERLVEAVSESRPDGVVLMHRAWAMPPKGRRPPRLLAGPGPLGEPERQAPREGAVSYLVAYAVSRRSCSTWLQPLVEGQPIDGLAVHRLDGGLDPAYAEVARALAELGANTSTLPGEEPEDLCP